MMCNVQFPYKNIWPFSASEQYCRPIVYNSDIQFTAIFYTCKQIFGGGYATCLHRDIPYEGRWDTGVDSPSCIQPNSRILIENPLVREANQKKCLNHVSAFTIWHFFRNKNDICLFYYLAIITIQFCMGNHTKCHNNH